MRISVLVTLVGLGVFAIAQAQRGSNPTPPEPTGQATAGSAPKVLSDSAQSARPIADVGKSRLGQPVRPTSVSQVTSAPAGGLLVSAAAAAEPVRTVSDTFTQPTNHVVRAVGTQSEPVVVREEVTSVANVRSEAGEAARPNPLRQTAVPVGLSTPVAPRLDAPAAASAEGQKAPAQLAAAPAVRAPLTLPSDPIPPSEPQRKLAAERPAPTGEPQAPMASSPALSPRLKPADSPRPLTSMATETREPARLPSASSSRMLSTNREIPPARDALSTGSMAGEGNGQPGQKQLEGPQTPQLTIQKVAPQAVQVGVPAVFRITVVNTGAVPAHGVEIRDQVPRGMQLIETKPRASRGTNGELVWELGTAKPGDELTVEVQLMPVAQGELGSVASVRFNAEASARTTATKPELTIKTTAPKRVMIGEEAVLAIEVSNPGTGVATNVVLSEPVPSGLRHPAGAELEYKIGTLKPGETRQIQLSLSAARPGKVTNHLLAQGDANLRVEDRVDMEIVAPQIDVAMEGPKRRFLEREATYTVSVMNSGTAAARQVELVAYLPRGLKFVSANNAGQYEPSTQSVHWLLAELPANDAGKVELVTMPVEAGQQKLRFCGKAERVDTVEKEQPITVEGIAAIMFEVADLQDPIEKGRESVYEIRVVNQGSKAATNVRVTALLPAGLRAVAAEGPTRYTLEANRVQFEGMAQLAPKADSTYRVRVQGLQTGDLRTRVQLLTDEMQEPVTKEESTRVYADE
jgi:uncharacterized repeat protein (TIGR01451 family)